MWSMFSQDFSDFAKAFKSESANFVDYLGHMASDVVGRGDVYAGDEVLTKTTRRMPLPNELVRRLQEAESTYALPIQPEEKAAFAEWLKANPLSSINAQRRQAEATAEAAESSPAKKAGVTDSPRPHSATATLTPSRRSTEWPDEPIDETRQRLLDYNDTVLQRYMVLVGDAVSPRSSIPASPVTPDTRRRLVDPPSAVKPDGEDEQTAREKTHEGQATSGGGDVAATTGEKSKPPVAQSPPSAFPLKDGHTISEDEFFDRYFFRLTQLRVSEAQRCRSRAAAAQEDSADVSSVAASAQRGDRAEEGKSALSSVQTSPQHHSPQTHGNDASRQSNASNDDEDEGNDNFAAVPLFAKRMMTAASGFVTNIDNALNNVVAAETSRCSGEGVLLKEVNSEDESANVDPSDLVRFRGANQQIADLELLVQELQETLRHERRRVQQLTCVLEEHHIEVPDDFPVSSAATPAKSVDAAAAAAEPTPISSSSAADAGKSDAVTADANPAVAESSQVSTAAAFLASKAPESTGDARDSPAGARRESNVESVGSGEEEDDEAWVSVSPSADPSVQ
jgi:hypothetical protein